MSKSANEFAVVVAEFLLQAASSGVRFTVSVKRDWSTPLGGAHGSQLQREWVTVDLEYGTEGKPGSLIDYFARALAKRASESGWTIKQTSLEICGNHITDVWEAHA